MLCVHLFKQRLRLFADLIVRVFLGLLGTSSRPRSFPHGPPRGWLPPSLHRSCSVLPWGCPALASCHLPPAYWVGLESMDLPSVTIYVQFWVPFLENKRELEEKQTVWVVVQLTRGPHFPPPPRRPVPQAPLVGLPLASLETC